jgi:hypothetical protein
MKKASNASDRKRLKIRLESIRTLDEGALGVARGAAPLNMSIAETNCNGWSLIRACV